MKAMIKTYGILFMIVGLISLANSIGLKAWVYNNPIIALIVTVLGALIYAISDGMFDR